LKIRAASFGVFFFYRPTWRPRRTYCSWNVIAKLPNGRVLFQARGILSVTEELYPHSPFGLVARLLATHKREKDRGRYATITDPLSRGFGIPTRSPDPLVQRAGRDHPFPIFAGSPWREREVARRMM